jgi:hypothetical protein
MRPRTITSDVIRDRLVVTSDSFLIGHCEVFLASKVQNSVIYLLLKFTVSLNNVIIIKTKVLLP